MMRKSLVGCGLVVAAAAMLLGTSSAEACNRCGRSCNSCYGGYTTYYAPSSCSTCYAPSSCSSCYSSCAPACAPACSSCAPACTTSCSSCYVAPRCCGNGYYYSYRAPFTPAYVAYRGTPGYYVGTSTPAASAPVVVQRSSVTVTPVRYEARRTSLFGW